MKRKTKLWLGVLAAIIILFIGFYLYNYYPQTIPGMAGISQELREEVNILFVGMDDLEQFEKEAENDSIVLLSFQAQDNKLRFYNISPKLIIEGEEIKHSSAEELPAQIEELTEMNLDYQITASYQGFERGIDSVEGIEIDRDTSLRIPDLELDLEEGKNQLNGREALNYARWRDYTKDEPEVDRLQRQYQIIKETAAKILSGELNISQLYNAAIETVEGIETDIDEQLVVEAIEFLRGRDEVEIDYRIFTPAGEKVESEVHIIEEAE